MKSLEELPKTTFSGRRFTRKQLGLVVEVVKMFGNLSRKELAQTLCEHLNWKTPNSKTKINSCLTLLEELQAQGFLTLPPRREAKTPTRRPPVFKHPPSRKPIEESLKSLGPVQLQRISSAEERQDWKAYLHTHHYLGYKHPVGCHLGYFVVCQKEKRRLGCLLFSASAAWALAPRDKWIGWEKKHRIKMLHLVLSNDRFLIFPWVKVPNLASHVLGLVGNRISDDWLDVHGYRPVLIETFVDPAHFKGTCYRAANWHHLGKTQGRGRFDPKHECKQTKKDIYALALEPNWRACLTTLPSAASLKKKYRNNLRDRQTPAVDETFSRLWKHVVELLHEVAEDYDQRWQVRKRIIDSKMLMLLIFRLVSSKNTQSYGTTIDQLWENCRKLKLPLPQKSSIAASTFCAARKKLDEGIFKRANREILKAYAAEDSRFRWLGHRLFAIDGSKINLPRNLMNCGYSLHCQKAYHPQGLLSCLYQVQSQLPFDFDLVSHGNERRCALKHLSVLQPNDLVVYDRGYYSYHMLHTHHQMGIHAIFRLKRSNATAIEKFLASPQNDALVSIVPSRKVQSDLRKTYPHMGFPPLKLRLIKYQVGGTLFCLGTTLVEPHQLYPLEQFIQVYHQRWGVEELYKVSKSIIEILDFHAKTERGVKQELFAHFVLITLNRLFANRADSQLNGQGTPSSSQNSGDQASEKPPWKTNFKNCIHAFTRNLEELLFLHAHLNNATDQAFKSIIRHHQRARPGRSYPRKSMKPISKWHSTIKKSKRRPTIRLPAP